MPERCIFNKKCVNLPSQFLYIAPWSGLPTPLQVVHMFDIHLLNSLINLVFR